jgi:hypothetical protein
MITAFTQVIPMRGGAVGGKLFQYSKKHNGLPNIEFRFRYTKFMVGNGFTFACGNTV